MSGEGVVANDVVDSTLVLFADLLDDRIERTARFALEVEELNQRRSVWPGRVEHMRIRTGTRQCTFCAGFRSCGAGHQDDHERHNGEHGEGGAGDEGDLDGGFQDGCSRSVAGVAKVGRFRRGRVGVSRSLHRDESKSQHTLTVQGLLTNSPGDPVDGRVADEAQPTSRTGDR